MPIARFLKSPLQVFSRGGRLGKLRDMRPRAFAIALTAAGLSCPPAVAWAAPIHVVSPGESLTSVAASDGLTVSQLAAANGLPSTSELIAGSQLVIPSQEGAAAPAGEASAQGALSQETSAQGAPSQETATSASGSYVVQPGDTLTAIAERAGATVEQLAASNGLEVNAPLVSGTTLNLGGAATSTEGQSSMVAQSSNAAQSGNGEQAGASCATVGDGDCDEDDGFSASAAPSTEASASGPYVVQPGDTLTAIAERAGTTVEQLAASNGIEPNAPLLSGITLNLSGAAGARTGAGSGSSTTATASTTSPQPEGAVAEGSPGGPPFPTSETVTPEQVGAIAQANGVSPTLAEGIAEQESGFNNALTSSANARGVMQITPGTWSWIQKEEAGQSLGSSSAQENVRGGVLLLKALLQATGGNESQAIAGYYQGLESVRKSGLDPSTEQYVSDVQALQQGFGGG